MALETISFRPDKKVEKEFEEVVREEAIGKSRVAREVFELGLQAWRQRKALEEFQGGKLSFLSAAKLAGLTAYQFLELLKVKKVTSIHISGAEIEREFELAGR